MAFLVIVLEFGTLEVMTSLNSVTAVEIPQSVRACIPVKQVARVQLVASTKKSNATYYLLNAYESNDSIPSDLLISVNAQNTCSLLLHNPMNDSIPLSRFVPIDVARRLVLQQIKNAIKAAGGKAKFQQQLLEEASQIGITYWTPEEVWTLQKLGIRLPKGFRVVSP